MLRAEMIMLIAAGIVSYVAVKVKSIELVIIAGVMCILAIVIEQIRHRLKR
jgi:hypothetical protein